MFPNLSFNNTDNNFPGFGGDFITDNLDTDMFAYIGSGPLMGGYIASNKPTPPICFNQGTQILCLNKDSLEEEYKSIEYLRKGDLVKDIILDILLPVLPNGYYWTNGIGNVLVKQVD